MKRTFVAMLAAGFLGAGMTYATLKFHARTHHLHCFSGRCVTHEQLEAVATFSGDRLDEESAALLGAELRDESENVVWFGSRR